MGLGKYIIISLLFILIISGYIYYNHDISYSISSFGYVADHPLFMWIGAILGVFFAYSLGHMLFYGAKDALKSREIKKDFKKIHSHIKAMVVGESSPEIIRTLELKKIADFLQYLDFKYDSNKDYKSTIAGLGEYFEVRGQIEIGEYVEKIEKYNIAKSNPLYIKNLFNKFGFDKAFYLEVIKNKNKYTSELIDYAFLVACEQKDFEALSKGIKTLTSVSRQLCFALFGLMSQEHNPISKNEYLDILLKANLDTEGYVALIKKLKALMAPNDLIGFVEEFINKDDNITKAYIYLLLDLEMLEEAKEALQNEDENDYKILRLFVQLKEQDIRCDINDLL